MIHVLSNSKLLDEGRLEAHSEHLSIEPTFSLLGSLCAQDPDDLLIVSSLHHREQLLILDAADLDYVISDKPRE
jgi:hypothetical protein